MTNDMDDDVDESFEEFDDGFEGDIDEDIDLDDDYEEDYPEEDEKGGGEDLLDSHYEGAVKANPKRMAMARRRKAASIVEGIISDAELSAAEGQKKAWEKLMKKSDVAIARTYDMQAELTENDIVSHPRFGIGFVIQLLSPTKVEVLFEEGIKRLVCNQKR